jgi:integrase
MTNTTHKVQIWSTEVCKGARSTAYKVRWATGGRRHKLSFRTNALADSFRSKLVTAARNGETFDVDSGLPLSMVVTTHSRSWYDLACAFVDMRWREASPNDRRTTADSLVPITLAMTNTTRTAPEGKVLRLALRRAFNKNQRNQEQARDIADALAWAAKHSRNVDELRTPQVLRAVLAAIDTKLDGNRAAPDTIRLRRTTLRCVIDYAIEEKALTTNPLTEIKTRKVKTTGHQVDRRCVANPTQARALLAAVARISPRLVAFFALMYFAALRPEEAANLRITNLMLGDDGWGEIHLERAAPEVGEEWTDGGTRSEERSLKHREDGVGRTVPCVPELGKYLRDHIATHTPAPDGRLFAGTRAGGRLGSSVYGRVWARARATVFTPEVLDTPLAKRPYDLRHAAVSTWLNAGVEATRVAEWAGHSVGVLLKVYAKCLDGGEAEARTKVQRMLTGGTSN